MTSALPEYSGPGLKVAGVNKTYPLNSGQHLLALSDINFELQKNQIGVLIGPSGCGKSTLLRLIAGLESLSQGEIQVAGKAISGPSPG